MCGRFVSSTPIDELAQYFGVEDASDELIEPNHNVAPTADVPVIFQPGARADSSSGSGSGSGSQLPGRRIDMFHWGLVPRWAKDPSVGNRMINARAETLATKNAFKPAFKRRRCILPVDGFYEWTKIPGAKKRQPWFIHRIDGEPLAFAGLWETWKPKAKPGDEVAQPDDVLHDDVLLHSVTIITGEPNEKMARLHHRMPVILPPTEWERWLDPENEDIESLQSLLVPAPAELITMYPVSVEVNNARNKGAHLLEPVDTLDPDGSGKGLPVPDIDAGEPLPTVSE